LADRGSEVVGEQSGTMRQGQTRLYVLWSEINTPEGVTIPIDSPGADALGAAGLDGEVDNHWGQRIGASLMLSLIDDAFAYEIAKAGAGNGTSTQPVAFQGTQQQSQRIAEKVLDSTINIPPTLYKKQGEKISIIIMRHLDFSSVYGLEPK
jgi:type IV secretion system protein VirB10